MKESIRKYFEPNDLHVVDHLVYSQCLMVYGTPFKYKDTSLKQ